MAANQGRGTKKGSSGASGRNTGRNSSGKKSTNSRNTGRSGRSNAARRGEPMDIAIRNEIILIAFLALSVILFLCNFGIVGKIGDAVSAFMFGVFGLMAYVMPVILFLAIAFGVSNVGNNIATRKLVAGMILIFIASMVFELMSAGYTEEDTYQFSEIYRRCSENRNGGGILAGSAAFALFNLLGMVGTALAMIVIGLICVVVVTDRSFINGVASQGRKVYERSMEDAAYRRERSRERREELEQRRLLEEERRRQLEEERENEKILRMDKKVSGVMLDTALGTGRDVKTREEMTNVRDDLHEIMVSDDAEEELPVIREQDTYHYIEHESDELNEIRFSEEITEERAELPEEDDFQEPLKPQDSYTLQMGNSMPSEGGITRERPSARVGASSAADRDGKQDREPDSRIQQGSQAQSADKLPKQYRFPPITLLAKGKGKNNGDSNKELNETAARLQQTLATFGVRVTITDISQGPAVTRYELQPEQGVKVSKIVGLADDIKLNLAATDIRIEAPIPGKAAVGIEVPNKENSAVALRDLLESKEFREFPSNLAFAVGKDIAGKIVTTDIAKMPHMLIAGATGSGKSVCINTIIMGLLYKAHPEDVKLIMIDPKVVELSVYNGIPHLLIPVVTDPKKAAAALHWGVAEMTERYKKFADFNVRDLKGYNKKVEEMKARGDADAPGRLPQILIIVDELADLMMVAPGEVEDAICRLAQLARAAGIHLIIATQRPSVNVITGLIKANMPSRIAFAVSSGVDSRTILDMNGAEKLLGKGDMLFYPYGYPKPVRVQGAFVSDEEVGAVVDFLKENHAETAYNSQVEEEINTLPSASGMDTSAQGDGPERDALFVEAGKFIIEKDKASIGMLQRWFKVGFNRAARIMDQLAEAGVVGEEAGTKPREILMTQEEFDHYVEEYL